MTDDKSSGEHLLTEDVARYVGVSGAAVRAAVADGRLHPAHRSPGGVAIFHRTEAVKYKTARDRVAKLQDGIRKAWRG